MSEEMKPWQHGYDLDLLKLYETYFKRYNSFALGPFAKLKKNDIAKLLAEGKMHLGTERIISTSIVKSKTPINMYPGVKIATKLPGDYEIKFVADDSYGYLQDYLRGENVWLWTWAEDEIAQKAAEDAGYSYVGGKVTTFGEVYSIWLRGSNYGLYDTNKLGSRLCHVEPLEYINIKRISHTVDRDLLRSIAVKVSENKINFENHYSNYNKDHAWSAVSLRGYKPDPNFITKFIEMNAKWQEEHKSEHFEMQNTILWDEFPEVAALLAPFDGDLHRVRLMKLKPGDGELQRHTDQVDPDSGCADGKVMRIHFPIITNPKVIFNSWQYTGKCVDVNMQYGECWYLDTRAPHSAINGGDQLRIHLVVDIEATPNNRKIILNGS